MHHAIETYMLKKKQKLKSIVMELRLKSNTDSNFKLSTADLKDLCYGIAKELDDGM